MKQIWLFGALCLLLLSSCTPENTPNDSGTGETSETDQLQNSQVESSETQTSSEQVSSEPEIVADHLSVPWSIQKDGDIFYLSSREGKVLKIEDGRSEEQEVALEEELSSVSEAGFLGFVLASDFSDTQEAYAYYTYEADDGRFNRIVRLHLQENEWQESETLLDEIPSGNVHHGGRLAIGPDDKLYATTGDATSSETAQDRDSLAGKILRLNLDGSIPDDNPFDDSYVYSYGHRNSQGLTWGADDILYASEHGNSQNDEINKIEAGKNYGWPTIEGENTAEGMEAPWITTSSEKTWAPSGIAYHEGKLYVAALRGTALLAIDTESKETTELFTDFGRIRDVYIDGEDLYFITNNTDGRGEPNDEDDRLVKVPLSAVEEQ